MSQNPAGERMKTWEWLVLIPIGAWLVYSWNCRNQSSSDSCLFSLPISTNPLRLGQ